ncbi:MAG: 30S ribosomal protein S8e [Candidatus Aenigmarchaeota archaeon]|nr:30S ribosomal protein S8e [Candidatus Aenigmarchaeota archaeon]MDW8149589.1 30S ribosomal protein S8e [Candidatus Aenigmarchaeota archaeon]
MAQFRNYLGLTSTGKKIPKYRKKKRRDIGSDPLLTKLDKNDKRVVYKNKVALLTTFYANVLDSKSKTLKKVKILDVVENKANPNFERAKIITKGALIKTEIGLAKVTSRPSRDGVVNAILIS